LFTSSNKSDITREFYSLDLIVSGARQLKITPTCSLYAVIAVEHIVAKTSYVYNPEPLWEESFNLEIYDPVNHPFVITILDLITGKILGKVDIDLFNYVDKMIPVEDWFPLSFCKYSSFVTGDIKIQVKVKGEKN